MLSAPRAEHLVLCAVLVSRMYIYTYIYTVGILPLLRFAIHFRGLLWLPRGGSSGMVNIPGTCRGQVNRIVEGMDSHAWDKTRFIPRRPFLSSSLPPSDLESSSTSATIETYHISPPLSSSPNPYKYTRHHGTPTHLFTLRILRLRIFRLRHHPHRHARTVSRRTSRQRYPSSSFDPSSRRARAKSRRTGRNRVGA